MHAPAQPDLASFDAPVRPFVRLLLARRPAWGAHLTPLSHEGAGGGAYLEAPSPADPELVLWAEVWPGEATVGLGWRAAEQMFVWDGPEHEAGYAGVVEFLETVADGGVVLAWRRERFLWSVAEQGRFYTPAAASADARVTRVQAWPGPIAAP